MLLIDNEIIIYKGSTKSKSLKHLIAMNIDVSTDHYNIYGVVTPRSGGETLTNRQWYYLYKASSQHFV